jgi:hypothetical protein
MTKLRETLSASAKRTEEPPVERRRASLPQPDFKHYKKAQAYPGTDYFFVGHSYDTEHEESDSKQQSKREKAIAAVLKKCSKDSQWLPIKEAIGNKDFFETLSRVERDWMHRLPESGLVGPAIDEGGKLLPHSFTVWRVEMRRRQSDSPREAKSAPNKKAAAAKPTVKAKPAAQAKPAVKVKPVAKATVKAKPATKAKPAVKAKKPVGKAVKKR